MIILLIIMKVYCPSYKRPDAPLFSVAKNLIIVLNRSNPEEVLEYKRINEPRGHTVIHPDPEQKTYPSLFGTRNWILEQNDDWSIQMDDDIDKFLIWDLESKSYINTSYDYFVSETEKIVNEVDSSKTGMIGYRYISNHEDCVYDNNLPITNFTYEITKYDFKLWQCVCLNNKLLKSLGFRYEDTLYFDSNGESLHFGEDGFIQCWCEDKNLDRILVNKITFHSIWNEEDKSVMYDRNGSREKIRKNVILENDIWLLNKFKHNHFILKEKIKNIYGFLNSFNTIKVFVPSHKRPDSKLFEIADYLNIVLQHEEDVELYSKWKNKHNVIYIPELKGLLDARNWILENNDDWVLMLDDDVLEFKEYKENITWKSFLEKTQWVLSCLDKSQVGLVGYSNLKEDMSLDIKDKSKIEKYFHVDEYFSIFQASILNCSLLKSKYFKYEGYPFDGYNGLKSFSEDSDLLCFCYNNNIPVILIEALYFIFDWKLPTICWENVENREKMNLFSMFWLLDKYKNNEKLSHYIVIHIVNLIRRLQIFSPKQLFEKMFDELSYESLSISKEEFDMKRRILTSGLILLLSMGFIICCDNGSGSENDLPKNTVDVKFHGRWEPIPKEGYTKDMINNFFYEINGTSLIRYNNEYFPETKYTPDDVYRVFSEEDILYLGIRDNENSREYLEYKNGELIPLCDYGERMIEVKFSKLIRNDNIKFPY